MTTMAILGKARARLLLRSAFFGTLLVTTPMVVHPGIPTACTDMQKIYYNPQFVESLSVDELMGLMAHEVLHIALMHGFRRGDRDPKIWNWACDYAINLILIKMKFKLPAGGLVNPAYTKMSAEQIYALLIANKPQQESRPNHAQGGDSGEAGKGGDATPGQGSGSGLGMSKPAAHHDDVPGWGADLIDPVFDSPEAASAARDEVRGRIVQATNMGRLAGNMPGDLLRMLDEVIHPPVPWEELLRPHMRSVVKNDESWSRRNRRFSDIYLPSRHSPTIGTIVVIGDTSGSITNNDLKRIGGSVISIAEEVNPQTIQMLWADTEVAGEQTFERGDTINLEPKGGGGTDMRVPLARAAELDPEIVILITDGYTPWPHVDPDFPLVVVCTTNTRIPVGKVVRI